MGGLGQRRFDADGGRVAAASSLDGKGEVAVYATETGRRLSTAEGVTGPAFEAELPYAVVLVKLEPLPE